MLEARIVTPRGSLYYAGDSEPYDLETLWDRAVRKIGVDVAKLASVSGHA